MVSLVLSALNLSVSSYTFTNLFPGTYIVNVAAGISNSQDTIVVGQIQTPYSINSYPIGVNCYNGSDGKLVSWLKVD